MYHIPITDLSGDVSETYLDTLTEAVGFASTNTSEGDLVTIHEAIQSLCGSIDVEPVLEWVEDGWGDYDT